MTNLSPSFVKRTQADFCTQEVTASQGTILPSDKDHDLFCGVFNREYRQEETPPHSSSGHRQPPLILSCIYFHSLFYISLLHD